MGCVVREGRVRAGYYDRVLRRELVVPLATVSRAEDAAFTFEDEDGIAHTIPLHRVRAVYRDGIVIWRRPGQPL